MQAGKLNQRIVIEGKNVSRSAIGEEVVSWQTVATTWAKVEPLRGREFFAAQQMQDAADYRITIRYRPGLTRDMRVIWREQCFDIVSVLDPFGAKKSLELICVSGVRNGR